MQKCDQKKTLELRPKSCTVVRGVQEDTVEAAGWIIQIQHFLPVRPQRRRRLFCIHLQQKEALT